MNSYLYDETIDNISKLKYLEDKVNTLQIDNTMSIEDLIFSFIILENKRKLTLESIKEFKNNLDPFHIISFLSLLSTIYTLTYRIN